MLGADSFGNIAKSIRPLGEGLQCDGFPEKSSERLSRVLPRQLLGGTPHKIPCRVGRTFRERFLGQREVFRGAQRRDWWRSGRG